MKRIVSDPSKALVILLPVVIIVGAPFIRQRTLMEKAAVSQGAGGDLEARNKNAFAMILGEIRATAADLMFIKTEDYIHGGIRYRPHIDRNLLATTGEVAAEGEESQSGASLENMGAGFEKRAVGDEALHASKHHHGNGHEAHAPGCRYGGVPTLIRTASEDFRGFIGDIERETKPYQDPKLPHIHASTDELLPWYKLMTLTDPHNVRGYMIGSMLLMFAKRPGEAVSFIEEGIEKNRANPQAFRLYASLAQLLWKSRYFEKSAPPSGGAYLEKALSAARTGYEMGKAVRPEGGEVGAMRKGIRWTDDIENDFLFLARLFPLLLERKGQVGKALRVAEEVATLAPDDIAIRQMVVRLRKKLSAKGQPAGQVSAAFQ